MAVAIWDFFRNSGVMAQLRSSRSRHRASADIAGSIDGSARPVTHASLRSSIAWWVALSLVGWVLLAVAWHLVRHWLG
jgi:hypothetical protein